MLTLLLWEGREEKEEEARRWRGRKAPLRSHHPNGEDIPPSARGKSEATLGIQNTHMPQSSSTLCFLHFNFLLLLLHLAFESRKAEMNACFAFWQVLKASEIL